MGAYRYCLLAAMAGLVPAAAATAGPLQPLQFFEGRTESVATVKSILKKPFKSRSLGRGRIEPDGSLTLVQRVEDEGKPPRERRWRIRRTGPARFVGTMSDASGPVTIDEVDGRFRFRFKMKGNLSVEQWLAPTNGGMAAGNVLTVRKLGMTVGTSTGIIRKVDP